VTAFLFQLAQVRHDRDEYVLGRALGI
jgi:hypothetical protein